jgi:putative membrane protein
MLIVGMLYHLQFMAELRRTRDDMTAAELIHGQSGFPVSFTFIIALLLLLVGFAAIVSMVFDVGPLG